MNLVFVNLEHLVVVCRKGTLYCFPRGRSWGDRVGERTNLTKHPPHQPGDAGADVASFALAGGADFLTDQKPATKDLQCTELLTRSGSCDEKDPGTALTRSCFLPSVCMARGSGNVEEGILNTAC